MATPPIGTARPRDITKAGDGEGDGDGEGGRAGGVGGRGELESEEVSESESNSKAAVLCVWEDEGRRRGVVDEQRGVDTYRRTEEEEGVSRRVAPSGVGAMSR